MLLVGKDFGLPGKENSAGIDKIERREPVLERDFLRPKMLSDSLSVIGAASDGGVICGDQAPATGDLPDARDDARGGNFIVIQAQRRQCGKFQPGSARV